jgi:apolipoprotein N-acyltransferase
VKPSRIRRGAGALSSRRVRFALAALSGLVLALSFPEASLGALVFVALAPLIAAIVRASSTAEALLLATASGTVTWLINVPWVIKVMHQYGGLPRFTGMAIYVAMAIALGLFAGIFFGAAVYRLRLGSRPAPWLLVPAAWVAVEYARTYLLSGFPWNQLAAAIIDIRPLVQLSAIIGPYGVGYFIVLPSTLLAWIAVTRPDRRLLSVVSASVVAVFLAWLIFGTLYVGWQERRMNSEPQRRAALLQPNITQQMRWGDASIVELFIRMMAMTESAQQQGVSVVVWPESTVPLTYTQTPFFKEAVEQESARGADIILGSVAEDEADRTKLWNAAYLVTGGRTAARYDKIKLVPFGEYVPLRRVIFFAEKLVRAVGDFQFGTNDRPLRGHSAYGLAICYEVVYPQIPRRQVRNGADVLVTITNDAWYDGTSALRQHLNIARLRTIEGDRYLLRAATTGITALVDPTGRIVSEIGEGEQGMLVGAFGPRQSKTPYVRFGDWFAVLSCAILGLALLSRGPLAARFKRASTRS